MSYFAERTIDIHTVHQYWGYSGTCCPEFAIHMFVAVISNAVGGGDPVKMQD